MAVPQRDAAVTLLTDYVSTAAQSVSFASNSYNVQQFSKYALQLVITAQSSLDVDVKVQATVDGSDWADVPGSEVNFTANGNYIWDNGSSAVIAVRLYLTFTAGSALFQIYGFSKL